MGWDISLSTFGLFKCSLWTDKIICEKTPSLTDYGRLWIFSSFVWESFRRYLSPLKLCLVGVHGDQTVPEKIPYHVIKYWKSRDHRHYQWGRLSFHPHLPAFITPFFGIMTTTLTMEKKNCGGQDQKAFSFLASNKIFPFSQIILCLKSQVRQETRRKERKSNWRGSHDHPFQYDRKSKVVSTPHKVKGKMYASLWGMFGFFLVLGSDKSVTVSRKGGTANLYPRQRRNYGITVGGSCWQSSTPFDGKHCWIEHVTKQLPPALALEWEEGTMDPLSKTRDMFNTEGSKDVLRKQKYHSSLCRLCLGTVSSNHSRGDWDSDKQDLGLEAQRGEKGGNWIKPVMLHRMMLKIERCLKTA